MGRQEMRGAECVDPARLLRAGGKTIKEIVRNTVCKVLQSDVVAFSYEREVQPLLKVDLDRILATNQSVSI
jgi:hypothetical protein